MPGQSHAPSTAPAQSTAPGTGQSPAVTQPAGNQAAGEGVGGGGEVCSQDTVRLPNPVTADGNRDYYANRNGDFISRYSDCTQDGRPMFQPPSYYMSYGDVYVRRFKDELRPRLSAEGQAWLDQAAINLQVAIEDRRAADAAAFDQLEKDDAAFLAFCYATHADAYWDAGLENLGVFDLARVALTPNVRDLVTREGLSQAADIGIRLLDSWGERAVDWAAGEGSYDELVRMTYEAYGIVGDGIDEVFGEGTAARLERRLEETASGAGELMYQGGEAVVDWVDSTFGEGTAETVAEGGRALANDAVDWMSDTWDDIWD